MNATLRVLLVASAAMVLTYVTKKIKKSQIGAADSLFWLLFTLCLFVCALFPQIPYAVSNTLGFQSPSNLIFFSVIGLLLVRDFCLQSKVAKLESKLIQLAQETALHNNHKKD